MRKRANNYDAQMAELGYTLFGDRNDESDYYAKDFYNYNYRVYIYSDEGLWFADVTTFGNITGEHGPFDSPIAAHTYVSNVYGFKTGVRMRKRADDVFVRMYSELVDYIEKIRDDAEQLIHANSHMLNEFDYGHLCGIRDAAIEILEKTGLY